jgi:hypothetical protein
MKTYSILGAAALVMLAFSSCDSPRETVVVQPPTTTTVTEKTITPDPYLNPGLTQTTETTTTRTMRP